MPNMFGNWLNSNAAKIAGDPGKKYASTYTACLSFYIGYTTLRYEAQASMNVEKHRTISEITLGPSKTKSKTSRKLVQRIVEPPHWLTITY